MSSSKRIYQYLRDRSLIYVALKSLIVFIVFAISLLTFPCGLSEDIIISVWPSNNTEKNADIALDSPAMTYRDERLSFACGSRRNISEDELFLESPVYYYTEDFTFVLDVLYYNQNIDQIYAGGYMLFSDPTIGITDYFGPCGQYFNGEYRMSYLKEEGYCKNTLYVTVFFDMFSTDVVSVYDTYMNNGIYSCIHDVYGLFRTDIGLLDEGIAKIEIDLIYVDKDGEMEFRKYLLDYTEVLRNEGIIDRYFENRVVDRRLP